MKNLKNELKQKKKELKNTKLFIKKKIPRLLKLRASSSQSLLKVLIMRNMIVVRL